MQRRPAGRADSELRPLSLELDVSPYAEGSCLISTGGTQVLCTASVDESVPPWRERSGAGWVTAEYGMLPRATHTRRGRERAKISGRTQEIQRLIGRSLRAVTDLDALGARTITLDCDVLQADGGTRTASITGAWIALAIAGGKLLTDGEVPKNPVTDHVAAVSVGLVGGKALLDLDYPEDSSAQVDMNVVGTGSGTLIEVQGTAEGHPFTRDELDDLLDLAQAGIDNFIAEQKRVVGW